MFSQSLIQSANRNWKAHPKSISICNNIETYIFFHIALKLMYKL